MEYKTRQPRRANNFGNKACKPVPCKNESHTLLLSVALVAIVSTMIMGLAAGILWIHGNNLADQNQNLISHNIELKTINNILENGEKIKTEPPINLNDIK